MENEPRWMSEGEHRRLIKIFNVLKRNATQVEQLKEPIILPSNFEKIAKEINGEI